jgi:hypothetical protein
VARISVVASVQLGFPLVEQCERCGGVADFIAQIIGNSTVCVDVEEMLAEALG